jgi:hypothetical protein
LSFRRSFGGSNGRLELEGGRREILSGARGKTVASFGNGTPFTLTPEERTSGWRGGIRAIGGRATMSFRSRSIPRSSRARCRSAPRAALRLAL